MTRQKSFKRRVRERMARTGETYTTARRILIARGARPQTVEVPFRPWIAEAKMRAATERGWQQWFRLLDREGAAGRSHRDIARSLQDRHGLTSWWAQTITVGYERARGRRVPGQNAQGWVVNVTKTVAVPVERLYEAFVDERLRERWLPGAQLRLRKAAPHRSARYDWEDGTTRVNVGFVERGATKSTIGISHERLPDADTAEAMRAWWREHVTALPALLEGGKEARRPRARAPRRAR